MSETFSLPAWQRAERYRAIARQLRAKSARYKGDIGAGFAKIAGYWEELARDAEARCEKEAAAAFRILRSSKLGDESTEQPRSKAASG